MLQENACSGLFFGESVHCHVFPRFPSYMHFRIRAKSPLIDETQNIRDHQSVMSRTLLHGMTMQWLILVHWNNWNILLGSFREETLKTIKNHALTLLVAKSRLQTATRLQVSGAAEANQTDERCVREPAQGSNDFPVLLSSGTSEQWSMWETMAGLGSCDRFECSEDVLIGICSCFGVSNWLKDMSQ